EDSTPCPVLGGLTPLHCSSKHECVECSDDADCPVTSVCDHTTSRCSFACTVNGTNTCGAPLGWTPFGRCEPSRHVCVDCLNDAQCQQRPLSDSRLRICLSGRCRQCIDDAGCVGDTPRCEP